MAPCPGVGILWHLALLGLLCWQGWMTLTLFGSEASWERLRDAQPIVSGRHPLHLYHGYLGAQAFRERGTLCCYDPAFQAGYPKTPVFDNGSRPAELFLSLAGGDYQPAAYKMGLAACCLLAPLVCWIAARGVSLKPGSAFLAALAGMLVWWGSSSRQMLEAGDLDVLLASLAALASAGMLIAFHRRPGVLPWIGVSTATAVGWFAQPMLFVLLFPLLLNYYWSVGAKHGCGWHLALLAGLVAGLLLNGFWLPDWFCYLWIRSPLEGESLLLPHRTFHTVWAAPFWGDGIDRFVEAMLLGLALLGGLFLNQTSQRPAARVFGLGTVGFLALAVTGLLWEPSGRMGTPRLLVTGLMLAVVPAGYAVGQIARFLCWTTGGVWKGAALCSVLLGVTSLAVPEAMNALAVRYSAAVPLSIGLTAEDQALIDLVRTHTTPAARILWEDLEEPAVASRWTALLPLLTERAFVGGLDPDCCIEHAYASLSDQKLAGRPLSSCSDAELSEFCRRYAIGWVVCRSRAAVKRFGAWQEATPAAKLPGKGDGRLFRLPASSVALQGRARLLQADSHHITLADVLPEDGRVVLSLHYQAGLRASPRRVQIEKEPDARDPIPLIRLRMQEPVSRVTLMWQDP
jgi:hypothetical protein